MNATTSLHERFEVQVTAACAVLALACGASAPPTERATEAAPSIEWSTWSPEAFERARTEGRMVLVDVGIEGCTACRWMFEDTYRNPEVVARIRAHFVPVSVDANLRPDLGERYSAWGWPATIVLAPDGTQVLAIRGNKRPRTFLPILDELIRRQRAGSLSAERDTPISPPVDRPEGWAETLRCEVVARLASTQDAEAGWSRGLTLVRGAPLEQAFRHAWSHDDQALRDFALRTAEAYSTLLDPVWGGVYVAGRGARRIVEKRTDANAGALTGFAHAYAITRDETWLQHAAAVHRYMNDWMMAEDGTFFATQEDDAPDLATGMRAAQYYELDDAGRRAHGIPPIDHGVYSDLNGRMISAYVSIYDASHEPEYLAVATRAGAAIAARRDASGWIAQSAASGEVAGDERMRIAATSGAIFLSAQARMGLAFLALFNATSEPRWLELARGVADASMSLLGAEGGGFYAAPPDGTEALLPRRVPVEDNAVMARFLLMLASATQHVAYRDAGEHALRAMAGVRLETLGPMALGELAMGLGVLVDGPVELSIVAEPSDPGALPLVDVAHRLWEPRKVVHFEPSGRYPRGARPRLHICSSEACSSPLEDPAEIATAAQAFRLAPSRCGDGAAQ